MTSSPPPTKNRPLKLFSSFLHDGIDSGLARATEMNARTKPLFPFVQKASLAFFDAYLKNSQPAVDYLKSHQLEKISRGVVDQQEQ